MKKIIFAIIPLIIIILLMETGARFIYYQRHADGSLAITKTFLVLKNRINKAKSEKIIHNLPPNSREKLFSSEGKELYQYYKDQYTNDFEKLVNEVKKIKAKLLVLYIPQKEYENIVPYEKNRAFFADISRENEIDFIDATISLEPFALDVAYLFPENGHLSRFGNKIIVNLLHDYLEKNNDFRAKFTFAKRPETFGDLEINTNTVWESISKMPYNVITNSQGLRMDDDLSFPKKNQRILILGDSFTFGPYLDNHDTYPGLLQKKYPDKDFINAGVAGYTISDELSLLTEKAKYTEPDIVILEVLDNDIEGMSYLSKNLFNRKNQSFYPSSLEEKFYSR